MKQSIGISTGGVQPSPAQAIELVAPANVDVMANKHMAAEARIHLHIFMQRTKHLSRLLTTKPEDRAGRLKDLAEEGHRICEEARLDLVASSAAAGAVSSQDHTFHGVGAEVGGTGTEYDKLLQNGIQSLMLCLERT
jgi:hypothetical protein